MLLHEFCYLLLHLGGNVTSSDLIRVSCGSSGDAHVQPGGNNYTKPCLLSLLILPAVNLSAVAWNKAAGSVPALGSLCKDSQVDCHSFICFPSSKTCCNFLLPAGSSHFSFSLSNYLCFVPYLSFYINGGKRDQKFLSISQFRLNAA